MSLLLVDIGDKMPVVRKKQVSVILEEGAYSTESDIP
jgi:hypothetical protein